MDGIFVAYHNATRIFGFQYLSIEEMDKRLFGGKLAGDRAFAMSVQMLEDIVEQVVACYPGEVSSPFPTLLFVRN